MGAEQQSAIEAWLRGLARSAGQNSKDSSLSSQTFDSH
jgi:hypothetical protein